MNSAVSKKFLTAVAALALAGAAQAAVVVGWTFQNASVGQTTGIAASTTSAGVSSASFSTGNHGVANFGGSIGKLSLTDYFGSTNYPMLSFVLSNTYDISSISFNEYHNHNVGFPTSPSYNFAVEFNAGAGWINLATGLVASAATNANTVSIGGPGILNAGTYSMRFIGSGFHSGSDSNSDYFGLDNVNLNGTVPEPTTLALVGLALVGLATCRRRQV